MSNNTSPTTNQQPDPIQQAKEKTKHFEGNFGMWIIGAVCGVISAFLVYLFIDYLWFSAMFYVGFIMISLTLLVITYKYRERIASRIFNKVRDYFGDVEKNAEEAIDGYLAGNQRKAKKHALLAVKNFYAHYIWIQSTNRMVMAAISFLIGFGTILGLALLLDQNNLIEKQNEYFREQNQVVLDQFYSAQRVESINYLYEPDSTGKRAKANSRVRLEAVRALIRMEKPSKDSILNLDKAFLHNISFDKKMNLKWISFRKAHLEGADLQRVHLDSASLGGAFLRNANCSGTHLQHAVLGRANLEGANLGKAHLKHASFWRADLKGAYLGNAHSKDANFWEAQLDSTDFYEAHLEGADLHETHSQGAYFYRAHLEGADFRKAYLEGADFEDAHLAGANFRGAQLQGAYFLDTRLEKVDFRPLDDHDTTYTVCLDSAKVGRQNWLKYLDTAKVKGIDWIEENYYIDTAPHYYRHSKENKKTFYYVLPKRKTKESE